MTKNDDPELFEDLSRQSAPERRSAAVARLRTAERRQVAFRAVCLDDLVPHDHRVRMVWRFVEGLDLSALLAGIKSVEGRPGHPPADPRILMALWLYATVEGVASARQVARLCEEHIAFQWLCGGVGMNAKTLADFRVGHGEALQQLLIDSFTALVSANVASLDRVAQDGVRVRAAAGAASFRRHSTLEECRAEAAEALERLRQEARNDPGAAKRRQAAARLRAAKEREERVASALDVTRELHEQQQERARRRQERALREQQKRADSEKDASAPATAKGKEPENKKVEEKETEPRASTTDAEARVMKMADGGFRPAYNVQFASDTQSGAVAGVDVDNCGSDMGKMAPMNEALAQDYGERPRQHLADGGYVKFDDIEKLEQAGAEVYAPVPAPRDKSRDRYAPQEDDAPAIAAWRKRMSEEAAKDIYKQRAATAECTNAQARNRGLRQFLVRGVEKVKSVAYLHGLTHNMVCGWRLIPIPGGEPA
jgi:transposase